MSLRGKAHKGSEGPEVRRLVRRDSRDVRRRTSALPRGGELPAGVLARKPPRRFRGRGGGAGKRSHAGLRRAPCRTAPPGTLAVRSRGRSSVRVSSDTAHLQATGRHFRGRHSAESPSAPRPGRAVFGAALTNWCPGQPRTRRSAPSRGSGGQRSTRTSRPAATVGNTSNTSDARILRIRGYAAGGGGSNFPGGAVSRARPTVRCAGRAGQLPESPSTDRDGRSERRLPVRRPGYRRGTGCRTRPSPQLASLVASQVTAGRPRGGTPAHRSPRPSATPGTSGPCRSRARR